MPSQDRPQIVSIVAQNIRAARDAKQLTQQALAHQLNVSPMYISRWERGTVTPSPPSLEALAEALDRPFAWFYTEHKEIAA